MSNYQYYFESEGVKLHVTEYKKVLDNPIVLLHGYPESGATWNDLIPLLQNSHRLIIPDLRGYGLSDKPEGIAGYDKFNMAKDLDNLMVHLKIDKFIVVGHDRGARVARAYALSYPEKVSCTCLVDIVPLEWIYDDLTASETPKKYWHWIWNLVPDLPEMLLKGHEKQFLEHKFGRSKKLLEKIQQNGSFDEYLAAFDEKGIKAQLNDYRATFEFDLPHYRSLRQQKIKLAVPTLLVWGQTGNLSGLPVMDIWEEFAADYEGHEIKDCGHFVPEENPEELANILINYLNRILIN